MAKIYKRPGSAKYSTKFRDETGRVRQRVLYTDQAASQRRANDLEGQASQRAAGVITLDMDHAIRPVSEHVAEYLAELEADVGEDHYDITEFMTLKLLALTGWKRLADITSDSVKRPVGGLLLKDGRAASRSYRNKFVTRARAFVNWLVVAKRIRVNVLADLEKFKKGIVRRDRRALEPAEVAALLGGTTPPERARVYEFVLLTGLRRNEAGKLRQGDLRFNASVPFIQLWEDGKTRPGQLPLHARLVDVLRRETTRMPEAKVLRVPDIKTFRKDVERAGIAWADERGRRADFHALRHTFATEVCRREPNIKKAQMLTRHRDVRVLLDIYAHLGIGESAESIQKVTFAVDEPAVLAATGTDNPGPPVVQTGCIWGHGLAQAVTVRLVPSANGGSANRPEKQADSAFRLKKNASSAIVPKMRPSTQVD